MLFLEKIVAHTMMMILMITSTKEDHLEIEIEMMNEGEDMKKDEKVIEEDRITMTIGELLLMRDDEMWKESHNRHPHRIWMINEMRTEEETTTRMTRM
jgi:hypothetical protein